MSDEPEWQPIESAPKDGVPVRLKTPDGVFSGRYWNMPAMTDTGVVLVEWISLGGTYRVIKPTHWAPLLPARP